MKLQKFKGKSTKRPVVAALIAFVLLVAIINAAPTPIKESQDTEFIIHTSVTYTNRGTGVWSFTEEDRTIGLFMSNAWQTVHPINHSYPLETKKTDEDGNPIAILQFDQTELKPNENLSYTVAYRVVSKPRSIPNINETGSGTLEEIQSSLIEKYCGREGPWLIDDLKLKRLADSIAKNETRVLTIIKAFIEWIRGNISYRVHEVPLYPNETYAWREGDCDDQAILFITLCRIYKIPAHLQIGCIYMPMKNEKSTSWEGHKTATLKRIGWHGWAIVYVPPWGWLPVDLTYVWKGSEDPLNAIKAAAVTSQRVIQYMNVTKMAYVASSRETREFLQTNDFYVHMQDEMIQVVPQEVSQERWLRWILVATALTAILVGVSIHIRIKRSKTATLERPGATGYANFF